MISDACKCECWKTGIEQLVSQTVFCHFQAAGPKYTSGRFNFCPWCGARLEWNDKQTEEEPDND